MKKMAFGTNGLRSTAQTTLSKQLQTALKLLLQASRVGISLSKLRVTGAARHIQIINSLGTSFTYFRIGNSGVVVIMDTFPVQGLRLLRLVSDRRVMSRSDQLHEGLWPNNWEEHRALLQSTSAAVGGYACSGDFSWRFLPPRVASPGVGPRFPPSWRHNPRGVWRGHVLSHLATALPPDPGSRKSRVLSAYLKFISPRLS